MVFKTNSTEKAMENKTDTICIHAQNKINRYHLNNVKEGKIVTPQKLSNWNLYNILLLQLTL